MEMETHYLELSLSAVLAEVAKGFKIPAGKRLFKAEPFVDPQKNAVVFKVTICDEI